MSFGFTKGTYPIHVRKYKASKLHPHLNFQFYDGLATVRSITRSDVDVQLKVMRVVQRRSCK